MDIEILNINIFDIRMYMYLWRYKNEYINIVFYYCKIWIKINIDKFKLNL